MLDLEKAHGTTMERSWEQSLTCINFVECYDHDNVISDTIPGYIFGESLAEN